MPRLVWLKTVNFVRRQYLSLEALNGFQRRAVLGEFATVLKVPSRKGGA